MTKQQQLNRLRDIADFVLERRLAALQVATHAKLQSEVQLCGLAKPHHAPADVPPVLAERVALMYQYWADGRRAELNMVLARQTANWIDARHAATEAFGKKRVIEKLAAAAKSSGRR